MRGSRQIDAPASPSGAGVVITVNPSAGSGRDDPAAELRRRLPGAEVIELTDADDLHQRLEKAACRPTTEVIGAVGGDGTLSCAAAVAARHGIPLLAIPGGTLNHLALDLGLDSVDDAIDAVVAGEAVQVDLPTIDGQAFVNTASFGAYAELVDAREALEGRIGKWPAALVAGMQVLRRGTPIEVELDGEPHRLWMIFIGNCRYQPDGFAPSRRARLDDGQLDIRVIDAGHPYSRTRLVLGLLTGRLGRSPVYRQWSATSLQVRSSDGPLRLARDGETFDGGDVVEILKSGQRVAVYSPIGGTDQASRGSIASGSMS